MGSMDRWQWWAYSAMILFLGLFSIFQGSFAQNENHSVSVTPPVTILLNIDGGIGPATQDFVHRGLQQALQRRASMVILQIDTPGGLSTAMRGIIKDILSSSIPVIAYVAPSGARAASAGTFILYASHLAAMAPGTHVGAATPVSMGLPGQAKESQSTSRSAPEQKAINDAKAYIRSLAQLRGRNAAWAEEAVGQAASLSAEEALKLGVINFIAKDVADVLQKAQGLSVVIQGSFVTLNTAEASVQTITPNWRSRFLAVITDPSVAYILLMIGVYGLFFEFASPGFILPGVVGAIALLLALYALQLLPISYVGLALMLLGIAFIVAEVFVPSFGALGIGGAIGFVIGSIMLLKTEAIGYSLPLYLIIIVALVTIAFFLLVFNMAYRSRRRPVVSGREALVGCTGQVTLGEHTMWVRIEGERWQCRSNEPLQDGQTVIVKKVEGLLLVVEPVKQGAKS